MHIEELIQQSIFHFDNDGMFIQYLLPSEFTPLKEKSICGGWLLVFHSQVLMKSWLSIHQTLKQIIHSNIELSNLITFERIHQLDTFVLYQNRGFNEAYTTAHYAEFLSDGDCEPNEWIIQSLNSLSKAMDKTYQFQFSSDKQKTIITDLIEKNLREPNDELKWTDTSTPWTLYLPFISFEDVIDWGNNL